MMDDYIDAGYSRAFHRDDPEAVTEACGKEHWLRSVQVKGLLVFIIVNPDFRFRHPPNMRCDT